MAGEADEDLVVEDDRPQYMGKAREEFNRRMRDAAAPPGDDEDPIQVHSPSPPTRPFTSPQYSNKSNSGRATAATPNSTGTVISAPKTCSMPRCVVGIAGTMTGTSSSRRWCSWFSASSCAAAVHTRTVGRATTGLRREEQQQRRQFEQHVEQDEGMFSPPGDPVRDDWAIPR